MTLDTQTKTQIRTELLLELNSCFSEVYLRYNNAREAEKEFLQTLINELRECCEGTTGKSQDSN